MFGIHIPPTLTGSSPHTSESFSLSLLWGLQRKPVWQGQHDPQRTAKRRARNRMARATRRAQRRAAR